MAGVLMRSQHGYNVRLVSTVPILIREYWHPRGGQRGSFGRYHSGTPKSRPRPAQVLLYSDVTDIKLLANLAGGHVAANRAHKAFYLPLRQDGL
jgi:hypothetical protein